MQFLSRQLGRWPVALLCVTVLAAAVLLPGLNSFGLWEPQERQLADRVAPRPELAKKQAATTTPPMQPVAPPKDKCQRAAPKDAAARTLTDKAMVWGRDTIGDSDAGRRLPLALLGLLTVLAAAGIAMRLGGPRAGVLTGLVLLSMPLLVFQSRQLTSEIGIAAGGSLIIYGLLALGSAQDIMRGVAQRIGAMPRPPRLGLVAAIADTVVGAAAVAVGLLIGFYAGGALLGVLVPVGAFAIAGALGIPWIVDLVRATRNGGLLVARRFAPRFAGTQQPWQYTSDSNGPALIATLFAIVIIGVLAYHTYSLVEIVEVPPGLNPPARALFGNAIIATGCWSWALGGTWRAEDDLRYSFDSTFEQIAYGTFPWGILGPIAIAALIASTDRRHRLLGGLTLAWASAAWIGAEMFQRKVGFTLWAGFPALAIAIGVWIDNVLSGRGKGDRDAMPKGAILIGLFVALAVINLGKDLQSFPERISSLLVGTDQIAYPKMSRLLFAPTKVWIFALGLYVALGFAIAMITWRDDGTDPPPRQTIKGVLLSLLSVLTLPIGIVVAVVLRGGSRAARLRLASHIGALAALAGTAIMAAFWAFAWQPALATHLSSKEMFDTYLELRKSGDSLVIMGDLGDAPYDYAPDAKPEPVASRELLVAAIARPNRVFAIAPQTELCQLHREIGGKPYFVIDDRNTRSLLLSNRVDGTEDKNPLRTSILHEEPKHIPIRPKGKIVWDKRIELLGWSMPKVVGRGEKFQITMFYKVLQPVGGNWKVLFHFDGALRFNGDHEPIKGRCQTSTWQPGDYIVDTHTVTAGAGAFTPGGYEVWTGFFTGSAPNWKNMTVEAPAEMKDTADRVKITTITLD